MGWSVMVFAYRITRSGLSFHTLLSPHSTYRNTSCFCLCLYIFAFSAVGGSQVNCILSHQVPPIKLRVVNELLLMYHYRRTASETDVPLPLKFTDGLSDYSVINVRPCPRKNVCFIY